MAALHAAAMTTPRPWSAAEFAALLATPGAFATGDARARSAATAHLEVAADNAAALALYDGAGYRRTGLRRGYYRRGDSTPIDAVLMAKALPAA
jgi:ribosomal-protein-alanine N-acetyltransferase